MDFKVTLEMILKGFAEAKVRYALIGGFALGALGVPRATIDLDFLINKDDLPKIGAIMKTNGYELAYRSENVSQYISPLKIFGEVDFLHAFREISLKMLERAIEKEVFDGQMKIKVLRPEDVIGLKIQALSNEASRETKDLSDIESLMQIYGKNLDWQTLEGYFAIFDQQKRFAELKAKYADV